MAFLPLPALPTARRPRAAPAQPTCSQASPRAHSLDTLISAGLGASVAAVVFVSVAVPAAADALSSRGMDAATATIARQAHDAASEGDRFLAAKAGKKQHAPYLVKSNGLSEISLP